MPLDRNNVRPVDPLLTSFMVQYEQETTGFLSNPRGGLFPAVPAPQGETGTYYTFSSSKNYFTLPNKTLRAKGTNYGRGQLGIASDTYRTLQDGWEIPVDDRDIKNALAPYDPRRDAALAAAHVVMLRREKRIVDAITNSTTFASYTAAVGVADRFDNDNSNPVTYIDGIKETIRGNCGRLPNKGVLAYDVWLKLKEHPEIKARIKTTDDTIVTVDLIKRLFGLEELYLSYAMYNSAEEGQTESLADMMSKKMFLGWINPSPSIMAPSVGYTIQMNGMQAKTYREEQTDSIIARAMVNEVHKIVAADCGYLLTTVIS
jgi:hypothetical protein